MLVALAAPLFALLVLLPAVARSGRGNADADALGRGLAQSLAVWAFRAAAIAAVAASANLVVQVAEIQGVTILAGADPALLWRFASATTVGRISVARGLLLVATAALAWAMARGR